MREAVRHSGGGSTGSSTARDPEADRCAPRMRAAREGVGPGAGTRLRDGGGKLADEEEAEGMTRVSRGSGSGLASGAEETPDLGVGVKDEHDGDAGTAKGTLEVSLVTVRRQPSRTQPGTHRARSTGGSPVPTAADSAAARP